MENVHKVYQRAIETIANTVSEEHTLLLVMNIDVHQCLNNYSIIYNVQQLGVSMYTIIVYMLFLSSCSVLA